MPGWQLFLALERCALPLQERLAARGGLPAGPAGALLRAHAHRELHRVLLARSQCQRIGRLARAHGWRVAVLKGGRETVGEGGFVDLCDVDLLPSPDCLEAVRLALLADAYRETGSASSHRLPVLVKEGALPIEVHTSIPGFEATHDVWARGAEREDEAGLQDLAPADRMWHLVLHAGLQHPEKRGCIRDLYLAMRTLQRCSSADVEEITRRCRSHACRDQLWAFYRTATELLDGSLREDAFRLAAAANYILCLHPPRRAAQGLVRLVHDGLCPGRERRHVRPRWQSGTLDTMSPLSTRLGLRALQRKAPRLARWIRLAWFNAGMWRAIPTARSVIRRARLVSMAPAGR